MPARFAEHIELPASPEVERSLLGACLLRPSLVATCLYAGLRPEHFSLSANAEIFAALTRMHDEGRPIDLLLLCQEVDVGAVGGHAYLADITTGTVLVESHILERCRIIQRLAQLRRIVAVAEIMENAARERRADPAEIAAHAIEQLASIAANVEVPA